MNLREALLTQGPSLALQRAAQAEIARLDQQLQEGVKNYSLREILMAARDKLNQGEDINLINLELLQTVQWLCEKTIVNRKAENVCD